MVSNVMFLQYKGSIMPKRIFMALGTQRIQLSYIRSGQRKLLFDSPVAVAEFSIKFVD